MRITIVTSTYPRYRGDGAGSFIHSLSSSLVQLGHDVKAWSPYDPAVEPGWPTNVNVQRLRYIWPDAWSVLGHARSLESDVRLKWHAFPLVALFSLVAVLRLWAEMIQNRSEVIYAHWLVPSGFIGAVVSRLTGVPLVIHLHGSDVFVAERYKSLRPAVRFILGAARDIIACSTDLAQRVIRLGFPPERVSVIPYGVDVERYAPDQPAADELRAQLSIPAACPVVMVMGRLVSKKGFAHFVRAAPLVLERYPNALFIVAGDGSLRAELETLAQQLHVRDQVLFTGHIPWGQTPIYMAMADVFVVPSVLDEAGNVDGLPNVLLEALACGRAVVASNVAGIPDVIRPDENGWLVPPKDEQALAEAVCRLLSDASERQRLGETAQATVAASYSWTHVARRVIAVLRADAN